MKKVITIMAVSAAIGVLSGCGTKSQDSAAADPYPAWYYAPSDFAAGLSDASCVAIPGGNMEIAKKQALANGKSNIAGQVETRIKAMDKTYDRIATTDEGTSAGGTFESVSKQVVNQSLSGIRSIKNARVDDNGKPYFCSLVNLDPEATKSLVAGVIKAADINLSADNESVLREQFNAYKAQLELDKELSK